MICCRVWEQVGVHKNYRPTRETPILRKHGKKSSLVTLPKNSQRRMCTCTKTDRGMPALQASKTNNHNHHPNHTHDHTHDHTKSIQQQARQVARWQTTGMKLRTREA